MDHRPISPIEKGFTLLEVLVGIAVLSVVSWTVFETYGSVLEIVSGSQYNSSALNIIESQVEVIRNMRYEDVGLIGGIPAGTLPATQSLTFDNTTFQLHTYIRNIDDPFDGTLGGTPADTAPADYKLRSRSPGASRPLRIPRMRLVGCLAAPCVQCVVDHETMLQHFMIVRKQAR